LKIEGRVRIANLREKEEIGRRKDRDGEVGAQIWRSKL